MNPRILKALFCIAIVLGLASPGVCGIWSPHTRKTPCEKSKSLDEGIGAAASGFCEMLPCHFKKGSLFLLGDSSSRQIKTKNRQNSQVPGSAAIPETRSILPERLAAKAILKPPLSFCPPPLFYLNCCLIC